VPDGIRQMPDKFSMSKYKYINLGKISVNLRNPRFRLIRQVSNTFDKFTLNLKNKPNPSNPAIMPDRTCFTYKGRYIKYLSMDYGEFMLSDESQKRTQFIPKGTKPIRQIRQFCRMPDKFFSRGHCTWFAISVSFGELTGIIGVL
jgi:hypothetical protein